MWRRAPITSPVAGVGPAQDGAGKAWRLNIFSFKPPHMRTFHVAWLTFGAAFMASVAPESLTPVVRNMLDLSSAQVLYGSVAALGSDLVARCLVGVLCDLYGHRYVHAGIVLLSAPAVFMLAAVTGPGGWIAARLAGGVALSAFVSATHSVFCMFSPFLSGTSTSLVAGWGNFGGGVAQLVLPGVFEGLKARLGANAAWRVTFLFPGALLLVTGVMVLLLAQDYPNGQYLQVAWRRDSRVEAFKVSYIALSNYRTWVLMLMYAATFGAKIAMYAVLPNFFVSQFSMDAKSAGLVTAAFGLVVFFARPLGGISSDWLGRQYGMKGRLWLLLFVINMHGAMCIVLGLLTSGFVASIVSCVAWSIMVQAAEGATIAVACFVSFRAQGTVQGLVGAAGPLGAIVYLVTFFNIQFLSNSQGFIWMGIWTCASSIATLLLKFPMWGSIIRKGGIHAVEEDYYGREWTREEMATGQAAAAMHFAAETISERGKRSLIALMHDSHNEKKGNDYAENDQMSFHEQAAAAAGMIEPELPAGRYGDLVRHRLALLDQAEMDTSTQNWDDFIRMHRPSHTQVQAQ